MEKLGMSLSAAYEFQTLTSMLQGSFRLARGWGQAPSVHLVFDNIKFLL